MKYTKNKIVKFSIVSLFLILYFFVSIISTIHVIDFFQMSNTRLMSIMLAIAFELGAAASLASIVILDKINKFIVWSLFIVLTGMQMMGNMFNSYIHLEDYIAWIELFGLNTLDILSQKRIISAVSGAILPVVALGFIKSLIDYIKPEKEITEEDDFDHLVGEDLEDEEWKAAADEVIKETVEAIEKSDEKKTVNDDTGVAKNDYISSENENDEKLNPDAYTDIRTNQT